MISVTDDTDGKGREGVEIELVYPTGEEKQYFTNGDGKIYLYGLQSGSYEVVPYINLNEYRMIIGNKGVAEIRKNATEVYEISMDFSLYDTVEANAKPKDMKDVMLPVMAGGAVVIIGMAIFIRRKRR